MENEGEDTVQKKLQETIDDQEQTITELREELRLVKFEFKLKGKCPVPMRRGQSVRKHDKVFIRYEEKVFSYNVLTDRWEELPTLQQIHCALDYLEDQLVVIGGRIKDRDELTGKITALSGDKWEESKYPDVPTLRAALVSVSTDTHLIVMGGGVTKKFPGNLDTVEVLDINNVAWFTVAKTPYPIGWQSAIIIDNEIFVLGGNNGESETKDVLTCSIDKLISNSNDDSSSVWKKLPPLQHIYATCAVLNGKLIAVGGSDKTHAAKSEVFQYGAQSNEWHCIGHLKEPRARPYVTTFDTKVMVFGGLDKPNRVLDTVEVACGCRL